MSKISVDREVLELCNEVAELAADYLEQDGEGSVGICVSCSAPSYMSHEPNCRVGKALDVLSKLLSKGKT